MRTYLHFLGVAAVFVIIMHVFSRGVGPLPALGPFLSFSQGVFKNAEQSSYEDLSLKVPGLRGSVSVIFDKNHVPHIFAKNEHDLFFAQGYVMAKYRLWQMDMSTRAGGAELSEVLGARAEKIDRFFINIGLREASERSYQLVQRNEQMMKVIRAYTAGVNQYISSLKYETWPVEYKVARAAPQLFSEQRVIQLIKIMSFNLAARSYDLSLTEISNKLGWDKTTDIFPDFYSNDLPFPQYDDLFHDLNGETSNLKTLNRKAFYTQFKSFPEMLLPFQTNGSNSWLVSKNKSQSGNNILSNDTHLGLKAPSVWFENRLHIDGQLDVYGASFPGTPMVILGANQNFSWGATNGTIDVVDWFEVEFKSAQSDEYLVDGEWKKPSLKKSVLKIRRQKDKNVETLWTEFGPVVYREGKLGLAVRWTAHEPSDESFVFYRLNYAQSVQEAKQILDDYKTPIQNFSLADHEEVAIYTAGIFPDRPYGAGRVVGNGRLKENNWKQFVHGKDLLFSSNPESGFLHSANQRPIGSDFKHYLGWDFEEPFRGLRIRERLSQKEEVSVKEIKSMQNEAFNELAFLFFKIVDQKKYQKFEFWKFYDTPESKETGLFYAWFKEIEVHLWKDLLQFQETPFFPKVSRTLVELQRLKNENQSQFEDLLQKTYDSTLKTHTFKSWGEIQPTIFKHVTSFPGFESAIITPPGSRYTLNANKGGHGGAWRFVVEMSTPIKAWSQIPGSTEGNPLSKHYSDFIKDWAEGKFKEVQFFPKEVLEKQNHSTWELQP